MVVDPEAVVPSAKVAVRVKTEPGTKRSTRSAAKRMAPLPSGRVKETAPSTVLRSGPSSEAATPRTQYGLRIGIPDAGRTGAAELEFGDRAGSSPRSKGEEKGAIEGAVGADSAGVLADTIADCADEGQGQSGGGRDRAIV